MLETLGLDDDLDPVVVVRVVEQAFDLKFGDKEIEQVLTVGEMYDLLAQKIPNNEANRKCATAMAFYRLRRALSDRTDSKKLSPEFDLSCLGKVSAKKLFRDLELETGLKLPKPAASWIGYPAGWIVLLSILLMPLVIFFVSAYYALLCLFGGWALAAFLIRIDPGRLPTNCLSLEGLARSTAVSSYGRLTKQGADTRRAEIWKVLTRVLSDFRGVPAVEIGRETYFLQSSGKRAKAAA